MSRKKKKSGITKLQIGNQLLYMDTVKKLEIGKNASNPNEEVSIKVFLKGAENEYVVMDGVYSQYCAAQEWLNKYYDIEEEFN